jgi:hypothetical protein
MENNFQPKYKIAQLLDRGGRRRALHVRRKVMQEMQCSASTYHRWLTLDADASGDIPSQALRTFAIALDVPMESLFNLNPAPQS